MKIKRFHQINEKINILDGPRTEIVNTLCDVIELPKSDRNELGPIIDYDDEFTTFTFVYGSHVWILKDILAFNWIIKKFNLNKDFTTAEFEYEGIFITESDELFADIVIRLLNDSIAKKYLNLEPNEWRDSSKMGLL